MEKRKCASAAFLLAASFLLVTCGCSATKKIAQKANPVPLVKKMNPVGLIKRDKTPEAVLKKRALVVPFIDRSSPEGIRQGELTASFLELLKKSPHFVLYEPASFSEWKVEEGSIEEGISINERLMNRAQELGMNVVISGVLDAVDTTDKKTGIWPIRSVKRVYDISVLVNMTDTVSRTLMMSYVASKEVAIAIEEAEGQDEQAIFSSALEDVLPKVLETQASMLDDVVKEKLWTGTILGIEDGAIKIGAGQDVGLGPDHLFEVFSQGEKIHTKDGRMIDLVGEKIGEIRVTSVAESHALAAPVEQGAFEKGQVIKSVP